METSKARQRTVQSVVHAINILEILHDNPQGMSLTEIVRATSLSKTATYHTLCTLEDRRFVSRDRITGAFKLGWALHELGAAVAQGVELTRVARPYLDKLAERTSEFVLLGILDDDMVLYLDRGESPAGFRVVADTGRRFPLHSTASGKILLAFCARPQLVEDVLAHKLSRITDATITDKETMRREIDSTRRQNFATCWEEGEVGLSSLAVPLHDYSGHVVAALSVVGISTRLDKSTMERHLMALNTTRKEIDAHMGYRK